MVSLRLEVLHSRRNNCLLSLNSQYCLPTTFACSEESAMVTTDVIGDTDSCNLEARFWLIKLSVLPVSMRASTERLFMSILTTAFF